MGLPLGPGLVGLARDEGQLQNPHIAGLLLSVQMCVAPVGCLGSLGGSLGRWNHPRATAERGWNQITGLLQNPQLGRKPQACLQGYRQMCLLPTPWVGRTSPVPLMREAGAKLQGCLQNHSQIQIGRLASKGMDRRDSLWVPGQTGLLSDCGYEGLEPVTGLLHDPQSHQGWGTSSGGVDVCGRQWISGWKGV